MAEAEITKAIGAGRLNQFDTAFGVMREASLNIAPCNATGQLSAFKITDPQALICAFPVTFGTNPYLGDSGKERKQLPNEKRTEHIAQVV